MQNGAVKQYRDRKNQVLFMDLRKMGVPYQKKYVELNEETRAKVAETYHIWQTTRATEEYKDIDEYCYSATLDEIEKRGFSLVPSKYIHFANTEETFNYDERMTQLQSELSTLLKEEEKSKADLIKVFKELGYEINV